MNYDKNLQQEYRNEFQKTQNETIQDLEQFLSCSNGKKLNTKIDEYKRIIKMKLLSIITKRSETLNFERTDLFTDDLINLYNKNIRNYENDDISFFFLYELPDLKAKHIDTEHEYPANYLLSLNGLAKLIANYNAIEEIKGKVNFVVLEEKETVTTFIEKIITNQLPELILASNNKYFESISNYLGQEKNSTLIEHWSSDRAIISTDKHTETIWFNVGLLFANGEIDKLIKKHNNNYTKIAQELNNKSFRPYISESISKTNNTDKNIFSSKAKLIKISEYCVKNNIPMTDAFIGLVPEK